MTREAEGSQVAVNGPAAGSPPGQPLSGGVLCPDRRRGQRAPEPPPPPIQTFQTVNFNSHVYESLAILQVFLIQKDTEAKGTYRRKEILRKDDLEFSTLKTKRNKM